MTDNDTGYAPPPPGYSSPPPGTQAPPRPLLRRTTGDANVLAGVAAGIARWLGIDPILVRVALVVLTIIGGSGILLYLAGWLFIPEDGRPDSAGERFFRNNNALAITAAVVIAVVVVSPMLAWGMWDGGIGFGGVVLLLLAIAGVFALTRRDTPSEQDAGTPAVASSPIVTDGPLTQPTAESAPTSTQRAPTTVIAHPTTPLPPVPPAPPGPPSAPPESWQSEPPQSPTPPREKSVLGRLTLGLALLVSGSLVALDMADVIAVDAVTVVASGLTVVALGLLVGTFLGRSRGLIAAGIVLALALIPLSAMPNGIDWNAGKGVGDRTYRVQSAEDLEAEYAMGAGELTLDLRNAELDGVHDVDVSLGAGELIVMLPQNAIPVTVDATVGVGELELPGEPRRGGVDLAEQWERELTEAGGGDAVPTSPDAINLNLETGLGAVTVVDETYDRLGSR